jgi:hypothetical protein
MDTATLVDERVDEGKRFLEHLCRSGFDVLVAFWVLASEDERWYLYFASSVVDNGGLSAAYRKVYSELSRSQVRWISRSDIKLIGCQNPIAVDAIAHQSDTFATVYRGRQLGNMIVEEAYIYPKRDVPGD